VARTPLARLLTPWCRALVPAIRTAAQRPSVQSFPRESPALARTVPCALDLSLWRGWGCVPLWRRLLWVLRLPADSV